MAIFLATRKVRITRNGGMQLTIPKSFLVNIKAEQGQKLAMYLDDKNQALIVKKVKTENDRN
jgi:bifunctional DNA-binding transcriptional regulator/antitoxin component of YhaV-PrlF toxin-antitoxin module